MVENFMISLVSELEKFMISLVSELENACINKESKLHVAWTRTDINLDFSKCRNSCIIDDGYIWNGVKICVSCDKILHSKLDKFNKSSFELAFENVNLENKLNDLSESLQILTNQHTHFTNYCI